MYILNMCVPRKFGSMISLPSVIAHEQRISLVLMVQDMIRWHNSGHIGLHQATYKAVVTHIHSKYVCAAQVWFFAIVTKCMAHEQRISLVLMVLDMIRWHNNDHIGPHQVTYEAVASHEHAEYVCAAKVWFYNIVTICNGSRSADMTRTHGARHD